MTREAVRAPTSAGIFLAVLVLLAALGAPARAETELIFWNFWDQKFIAPVIARFEAEHPGVKIRSEQLNWGNGLDKIVVALANGRTPDICEFGSTWTGKFMSEGVLVDITEGVSDLRDAYHLWEPATWEGRIYGMPWLVGTRVLFYNRALFKAAGLDPDKPPRTWDELIAAAKAIHQPDKGVYGFGVNAGEGHILYKKFLPFVWGNGGTILDGAGNFGFDSPAAREALGFYRRLMEFGLKEKQDVLDDAFKKGRLGLEISGSWNFAKYPKEAPDLDFGTALIPAPAADRGRSCSFLGGEILVLFKNCRDPKTATEFLRFLTRAEHTLPITKEALVSFPADKAAYSDEFFKKNPKLGVFVKQMETAVHPPVHPLWIELESIINDAVEKVLYGGSIDEVLGAAATAYERVRLQFDDRRKTSAGARQGDAPVSAGPANLPVWAMVLLVLISVGTIVNAVLLVFVYGEVKKKRRLKAAGRNPSPHPARKPLHAVLFLLPWILTFLVFWLYPLAFSFLLSFCEYDVFRAGAFRWTGFDNVVRLFGDARFLQAFGNTLFFVIGTTPVTTALALVLALMVERVRAMQNLFRSAFFLPSIISMVVIATIFKSFYAPDGLLNELVSLVGAGPHAWLIETGWAMPAIMAMDVWSSVGYYMVLFLAALKSVPAQLYEAAEVDGAGEWAQFRHITLPQIRGMALFIVVINTIRSWQVFPEIFTLTRGGPLGTTDTLVHRVYETAFRYHEMGYASAMAWVLFAVIMALSLVQMRILRERR